MVGIVVVSHSAELARGVVALAREMGGEDLALEEAGGLEDGSMGTDAERVRAAIERAMSDDGVLVLMDLGSALMSTEMAVELMEGSGRVVMSEAPLVEGAVAAAAAARGGASLDEVRAEAQGALRMKAAQLGGDEVPDGDVPAAAQTARRTRTRMRWRSMPRRGSRWSTRSDCTPGRQRSWSDWRRGSTPTCGWPRPAPPGHRSVRAV